MLFGGGFFLGVFPGELKPGVELRQDGCDVLVRPYPRRVAGHEVESAAGGEHVRELQLPVEEPLPLRDLSGDGEPRVAGRHLVNTARPAKGEELLFGVGQLEPAVGLTKL